MVAFITNFMKEFKEFAMRGNVIDLAVGVVIGAAFNNIVNSVVADLFTPLFTLFSSTDNDFSNYVLGPLRIGKFINAVLSFLIIAFALFLVIKLVNSLKLEAKPVPPEPAADVKLLTEIRDLLKARARNDAA
jgi:large conductance mechanosensitive channel